ncbi:hypothetical protein GCM10022414_19670 [Zhongshania borealis]|uniref:Uncharacterized protein n=1 Tax=Zhongshania borealis TaxID=889488 RepID=A0ABP7WS77_9GAMM
MAEEFDWEELSEFISKIIYYFSASSLRPFAYINSAAPVIALAIDLVLCFECR